MYPSVFETYKRVPISEEFLEALERNPVCQSKFNARV